MIAQQDYDEVVGGFARASYEEAVRVFYRENGKVESVRDRYRMLGANYICEAQGAIAKGEERSKLLEIRKVRAMLAGKLGGQMMRMQANLRAMPNTEATQQARESLQAQINTMALNIVQYAHIFHLYHAKNFGKDDYGPRNLEEDYFYSIRVKGTTLTWQAVVPELVVSEQRGIPRCIGSQWSRLEGKRGTMSLEDWKIREPLQVEDNRWIVLEEFPQEGYGAIVPAVADSFAEKYIESIQKKAGDQIASDGELIMLWPEVLETLKGWAEDNTFRKQEGMLSTETLTRQVGEELAARISKINGIVGSEEIQAQITEEQREQIRVILSEPWVTPQTLSKIEQASSLIGAKSRAVADLKGREGKVKENLRKGYNIPTVQVPVATAEPTESFMGEAVPTGRMADKQQAENIMRRMLEGRVSKAFIEFMLSLRPWPVHIRGGVVGYRNVIRIKRRVEEALLLSQVVKNLGAGHKALLIYNAYRQNGLSVSTVIYVGKGKLQGHRMGDIETGGEYNVIHFDKPYQYPRSQESELDIKAEAAGLKGYTVQGVIFTKREAEMGLEESELAGFMEGFKADDAQVKIFTLGSNGALVVAHDPAKPREGRSEAEVVSEADRVN